MDNTLLDLEQSFINMAPSGYYKRRINGLENAVSPALERVSAVQNYRSTDFGHHATAKALSMYRTTSGCSEVSKKRFQHLCCQLKLSQKENKQPGYSSSDCPANQTSENILVSSRNLYKRDAEGHLHLYHFTISFFTGKSNDLVKDTAQKISRQEGCLKITPEKISALRPSSIETGIMFPTSADYMSLSLDRSKKICKLAQNKFMRQSSLFTAELESIAANKYRVNRPLPTISQLHAISRYVFVKLNAGDWPLNFLSREPQQMKLFDPMNCWRHSTIYGDQRLILPPMQALLAHIATSGLSPLEFSGDGIQESKNRRMLQNITSKIEVDIINEIFTPVESHNQAEYFQRGEFISVNPDLAILSKPQTPRCRSPTPPNCLITLEFALKPTERVRREFRKTQSLLHESDIR